MYQPQPTEDIAGEGCLEIYLPCKRHIIGYWFCTDGNFT